MARTIIVEITLWGDDDSKAEAVVEKITRDSRVLGVKRLDK
jgi:hypothetical protein